MADGKSHREQLDDLRVRLDIEAEMKRIGEERVKQQKMINSIASDFNLTQEQAKNVTDRIQNVTTSIEKNFKNLNKEAKDFIKIIGTDTSIARMIHTDMGFSVQEQRGIPDHLEGVMAGIAEARDELEEAIMGTRSIAIDFFPNTNELDQSLRDIDTQMAKIGKMVIMQEEAFKESLKIEEKIAAFRDAGAPGGTKELENLYRQRELFENILDGQEEINEKEFERLGIVRQTIIEKQKQLQLQESFNTLNERLGKRFSVNNVWVNKLTSAFSDSKEMVLGVSGTVGQLGKGIGTTFGKGAGTIAKFAKVGLGAGLILGILLLPIIASFKIFNKLVSLGIERLTKIEDAVNQIRTQFGILPGQANELNRFINNNMESMQALGVDAGEFASNIASAQERFGFVREISKDELDVIAQLNARLGTSGEVSAGFLDTMSLIGDESKTHNAAMAGAVIQLAKAGRVAPGKIMEDIANNSEVILENFTGTDLELSKAVITANQLGLSVSDIAAVSKQLLDFESSLSAEMEFMALSGRNLNLQRARTLAYQGDLNNLSKELLRVTREQGSLENMSVLERQKFAAAIGLSVGQLTKMVKLEDQLSRLGSDTRSEFEALSAEMQETLAARGEFTKQDVMNLKAIQDRQNTMERIKNTFGSFMSSIGAIAMPYVEKVLSRISQMTEKFRSGLWNPEGMEKLKAVFGKITSTILSVFDKFENGNWIDKLHSFVQSVILVASEIVRIISSVANLITGGNVSLPSAGRPSVTTARASAGNNAVSSTLPSDQMIETTAQRQATLPNADSSGNGELVSAINRLNNRLDQPIYAEAYLDGRQVSKQLNLYNGS